MRCRPSRPSGSEPAPIRSRDKGFAGAFLVRVLFSCLVDADSLETERFSAEPDGRDVDGGDFRDLATLRDRLRIHMENVAGEAEETELDALRAEVLRHATERAATLADDRSLLCRRPPRGAWIETGRAAATCGPKRSPRARGDGRTDGPREPQARRRGPLSPDLSGG